jgi:hypothetical protein
MSDRVALGKKVTRDDLIMGELKGKHEAIGRYDTILWRVRSGYLAALYATLLLFAGKEGGLARLFDNPGMVRAAITTIVVLSLALALMDFGFRLRQLKVVHAYNRLSDVTLRLAAGEEVCDDEVRLLLHIAGESSLPVDSGKRLHAVLLILALYLAVPLLAGAAYALIADHAKSTATG